MENNGTSPALAQQRQHAPAVRPTFLTSWARDAARVRTEGLSATTLPFTDQKRAILEAALDEWTAYLAPATFEAVTLWLNFVASISATRPVTDAEAAAIVESLAGGLGSYPRIVFTQRTAYAFARTQTWFPPAFKVLCDFLDAELEADRRAHADLSLLAIAARNRTVDPPIARISPEEAAKGWALVRSAITLPPGAPASVRPPNEPTDPFPPSKDRRSIARAILNVMRRHPPQPPDQGSDSPPDQDETRTPPASEAGGSGGNSG